MSQTIHTEANSKPLQNISQQLNSVFQCSFFQVIKVFNYSPPYNVTGHTTARSLMTANQYSRMLLSAEVAPPQPESDPIDDNDNNASTLQENDNTTTDATEFEETRQEDYVIIYHKNHLKNLDVKCVYICQHDLQELRVLLKLECS